MSWLSTVIDRFVDWYWNDPIARKRRQVEVDARALGGEVTWSQDQ